MHAPTKATLLALLFARSAGASPLPAHKQHVKNSSSPPSPYPEFILSKRTTIDTDFYNPYNASLPNVTIYATGGTIAGAAASADQTTTGYEAGALGVDALLGAVPQLANVANVRGVQVANVGSEAVTTAILLRLAQEIRQHSLDDPACQGVVVTHGTDTLEESAFFLDLTLSDSSKPVVFVGAMRPATAMSADGPENLLAAVTLAASPAARGRGGLVVLNDRIASSWYTTKTNANALDTFEAREQGYLGAFINVQPIFYYDTPATPLGKPAAAFDVTGVDALPQVSVLYGHQDLDPGLATAAVAGGARGLVLAGMGAGGWTDAGKAVLADLVARNGTKVVVSRRTMDGYVEPTGREGMYGGGFLNPQKARILLQLGLNAGLEEDELRALFEHDGN